MQSTVSRNRHDIGHVCAIRSLRRGL